MSKEFAEPAPEGPETGVKFYPQDLGYADFTARRCAIFWLLSPSSPADRLEFASIAACGGRLAAAGFEVWIAVAQVQVPEYLLDEGISVLCDPQGGLAGQFGFSADQSRHYESVTKRGAVVLDGDGHLLASQEIIDVEGDIAKICAGVSPPIDEQLTQSQNRTGTNWKLSQMRRSSEVFHRQG